MKSFGSILWMFFAGLLGGIPLIVFGAALCMTLIGIPLGLQCFKLAKTMLFAVE